MINLQTIFCPRSQVAGRILWCRQLFRKIEAPMLILKKKLDTLKVSL